MSGFVYPKGDAVQIHMKNAGVCFGYDPSYIDQSGRFEPANFVEIGRIFLSPPSSNLYMQLLALKAQAVCKVTIAIFCHCVAGDHVDVSSAAHRMIIYTSTAQHNISFCRSALHSPA